MLAKRLATSVKKQRTHVRWTQEQAAEAIGITTRNYQLIEGGHVNCTLRTVERICEAFGVDAVQLFTK